MASEDWKAGYDAGYFDGSADANRTAVLRAVRVLIGSGLLKPFPDNASYFTGYKKNGELAIACLICLLGKEHGDNV